MATEDEQDWVTVTYGEEKFGSVNYSSFTVGQLSMRTKVAPDETPTQAIARAYEHLEKTSRAIFRSKRDEHFKRLREVGDLVGR